MFSLWQVALYVGGGVFLVSCVVLLFVAKDANARERKYEADQVAAGYPAKESTEGPIAYHERIDRIKATEKREAEESRDPADTLLALTQTCVEEMARFEDLTEEGLTRELRTFSKRDLDVMVQHGMVTEDERTGKVTATDYAGEVVATAREHVARYGDLKPKE